MVLFFNLFSKESYIKKVFSGTATTTKCFIFQSVMEMIGRTRSSKTAAGNTCHTMSTDDAYVQTIVILQKQFYRKCNRVLTSQKESAKHFFQLLGYTSLLALRKKHLAWNLKCREYRDGNSSIVSYINGTVVE